VEKAGLAHDPVVVGAHVDDPDPGARVLDVFLERQLQVVPADVRQPLSGDPAQERAGCRGVHQLATDGPGGEPPPVALGRFQRDRKARGGEHHVGLQGLGEMLGPGTLLREEKVEGHGPRTMLREIARRVGEDVVRVRPWAVFAHEPLDRRLVGIEDHDRVEIDRPGKRALEHVGKPPVESLVESGLGEQDRNKQCDQADGHRSHACVARYAIGQHDVRIPPGTT